ncbi:ferredoxin-type protein NapF [Inmirania thermothiophila]|nr:ferredoxin-type protein NapF [Inmirania thermothiophila]
MERRAFLRGRRRLPQPLRPPGACAEAVFVARCDRCDGCIRACPERILRRGGGGFPEIDFTRGGCTFCGRCVTACARGALAPWGRGRPWMLEARLDAACLALQGIGCMSCLDACPREAIALRPLCGRLAPQVDAARCDGCGACVRPCPVGAIRMVRREDAARGAA